MDEEDDDYIVDAIGGFDTKLKFDKGWRRSHRIKKERVCERGNSLWPRIITLCVTCVLINSQLT